MAELGLDMLNPRNWIPNTWQDTLGCLGVLVVSAIYCILLSLPTAWIKHDYCTKCHHEIHSEHYCPRCGTPTDSVDTYNYWNKPKGY